MEYVFFWRKSSARLQQDLNAQPCYRISALNVDLWRSDTKRPHGGAVCTETLKTTLSPWLNFTPNFIEICGVFEMS